MQGRPIWNPIYATRNPLQATTQQPQMSAVPTAQTQAAAHAQANLDANRAALRAFLEAEAEYRRVEEVLKARRQVMVERKLELIKSFQARGVSETSFMLPDQRKLDYVQVSTRSGVTKKLLQTSLAEFLTTHHIRVDPKEAVEFIWNRRPASEPHWEIQLKSPKDKVEDD